MIISHVRCSCCVLRLLLSGPPAFVCVLLLFFRFLSSLSLFFFFSSRRRHTRYIGDWSSDVCSSDLSRSALAPPSSPARSVVSHVAPPRSAVRFPRRPRWPGAPVGLDGGARALRDRVRRPCLPRQIGRASCRERVSIDVMGGSLDKRG